MDDKKKKKPAAAGAVPDLWPVSNRTTRHPGPISSQNGANPRSLYPASPLSTPEAEVVLVLPHVCFWRIWANSLECLFAFSSIGLKRPWQTPRA